MSARGVLGNAYLVFAPKEMQSSACAAGKILGVSGVSWLCLVCGVWRGVSAEIWAACGLRLCRIKYGRLRRIHIISVVCGWLGCAALTS